jgi:hypothetical protein
MDQVKIGNWDYFWGLFVYKAISKKGVFSSPQVSLKNSLMYNPSTSKIISILPSPFLR